MLRYKHFLKIQGNSSYKKNQFGIELVPGLKTNIKVERVFEKQLPKPYSSCDIDNDAPQAIHSDLYKLKRDESPYEYNRQLCFEICTTRLVIDQCNCSNSDAFHFFPNTRPCSPNNKCLNSLKTKFISNDFIMANCKRPLQCNRTLYRMSTSASSLLGQFYADKIKRNANLTEDFDLIDSKTEIDPEMMRLSLVRVLIYYESLAYTQTTESASQLSILFFLGTIGGIVSLFLGVNVLSLFELLEALMDVCLILKRDKQ